MIAANSSTQNILRSYWYYISHSPQKTRTTDVLIDVPGRSIDRNFIPRWRKELEQHIFSLVTNDVTITRSIKTLKNRKTYIKHHPIRTSFRISKAPYDRGRSNRPHFVKDLGSLRLRRLGRVQVTKIGVSNYRNRWSRRLHKFSQTARSRIIRSIPYGEFRNQVSPCGRGIMCVHRCSVRIYGVDRNSFIVISDGPGSSWCCGR